MSKRLYRTCITGLVLSIIACFAPIFVMLLAPSHFVLPMVFGHWFGAIMIFGFIAAIKTELNQ